MRDLFAAVFFAFFGLATNPADIPPVLLPALGLAIVIMATKVATGYVAARRVGIAVPGRLRAGLGLMPRGEFSIVIAGLAAGSAGMTPLATAYVLITVVSGPLLGRLPDADWFKAWLRRRAESGRREPVGGRSDRGRPAWPPCHNGLVKCHVMALPPVGRDTLR